MKSNSCIMASRKITCNKAQCRLCSDVIESTYAHDFKWCKCGAIGVDGGRDYANRFASDSFDDIIELSTWSSDVNIK